MNSHSSNTETGVRLYEAGLPFASYELLQTALGEDLAPLTRVRVLNVLALCSRRLKRLEEALALLDEAVTLAGRLDAGWLVRSLTNRAIALKDLGRLEEALQSAFQASQMANESLGIHVVTGVQHTVGEILLRQQRYEEAISHLHEAWQAATLYGNVRRMARVANDLGVACSSLSRLDSAKVWFDLALEQAEASSDWSARAFTYTELGRLSLAEGRVKEAANAGILAMRLLWLNVHAAAKEEIARICELLGMVASSVGQTRVAEHLLHRAVAYYGQLGLWREWESLGTRMRQGLPRGASEVSLPYTEIRQLEYLTTALGLLDGIESLVPSLRHRGEHITHYASILAGAVEADGATREGLAHAGRLADIGLTILGPLDPVEEELTPNYTMHPVLGERWLRDFPGPAAALAQVRNHHEAWDGSGFPDGLAGTAIPLGARILAVCDGYVRRAMKEGHQRALAHLQEQAGRLYDPQLVHAFTELHA